MPSRRPDTTRSRGGKGRTTVSRSLPGTALPLKRGARCPVIPPTRRRVIWKARSTGCWCVACTHQTATLSRNRSFDYKLAWFARLIQHAAELNAQGLPVVLLGDYNVVPTDFDIYSPRSWQKNALLQPEPRRLYAWLLECGWSDALRTFSPAEPMFTFWHYFRDAWPRDAGFRIDHLLLNDAVAKRFVAAGVDRHVRGRPNASDHAPAWIVFARLAGDDRDRLDLDEGQRRC